MDVESLFSHVPINETINFICNRLYRSDEIQFPIPEDILCQLLQACTKEVPFYRPDKNMYVQIDGVAMGSPLGVLFANFYMGSTEEMIFTQHYELKPSIYTRYIDDIFISADTEDSLSQITEMFKENSSPNYTHEIEIERKLPFLDTVVHRGTDSFSTEVYVKPTNLGFCLNGASECPERYRRSVINSFVKRALTHCSTWTATNAVLKRISQLSNNGYKKEEIYDVIRGRLDTFMAQETRVDNHATINLYYKNDMSSAYKQNEKMAE
ncbi:uncharacterized protein LOC143036158 [Oratosquilla oratoria]|uniref:uncharacterized protein LOC143036158 n=1 Tax=Oratosquilla oratoria TaxID=337810 RepID=UPI003F7660B7